MPYTCGLAVPTDQALLRLSQNSLLATVLDVERDAYYLRDKDLRIFMTTLLRSMRLSHSCRVLRTFTHHRTSGIDVAAQISRSRVPQRYQHTASQNSHLPRLAQPSIWHSIIPKGLRSKYASSETRKKPKNPATYFIWIYLLIGSQAIRIMGLKTDFTTFTRRADLKIAQLREVVEKLQKGEDVDVEKVLGTGDEVQEQDWEEALRELQEQDRIWQNNARKSREERERLAAEERDANPVSGSATPRVTTTPVPPSRPGFY
jgi:hypothetical protein